MSDMSKREFETVLVYFQAKIVCSDMNGAPCILHKIARICRFLGNLYSKINRRTGTTIRYFRVGII